MASLTATSRPRENRAKGDIHPRRETHHRTVPRRAGTRRRIGRQSREIILLVDDTFARERHGRCDTGKAPSG